MVSRGEGKDYFHPSQDNVKIIVVKEEMRLKLFLISVTDNVDDPKCCSKWRVVYYLLVKLLRPGGLN